MCGRYSLAKNRDQLARRFNVEVPENWKPRYNIAPMQQVPVITNRRTNELLSFQWGLIPNWSEQESMASNLINARSETVLSKTPFKQIIRTQRCLIPSDGFFEWKKAGKNKLPHRITLASDEIFAFAGLWDFWESASGEVINSCTIITTAANSLVRDIHERMPVILTPENEALWLSEKISDMDIQRVMQPFDSDKMSYYQAHKVVNSTAYDYPECIHVAPKIYPGETFSLFD